MLKKSEYLYYQQISPLLYLLSPRSCVNNDRHSFLSNDTLEGLRAFNNNRRVFKNDNNPTPIQMFAINPFQANYSKHATNTISNPSLHQLNAFVNLKFKNAES
jgi:hypothetical protein